VRSANPAFDSYDDVLSWAISAALGGSPGTADTSGFSQVFEGWRYEHFSSAELQEGILTGADANPDGDEGNNFAEYAFGGDPRVADGGAAPVVTMVNIGGTDYLALQFERRKAALDLTYTVEATSDILDASAWTAITTLVGTPQDLGNGLERVIYRDTQPEGSTPRFFRVRAAK